MNVLSAVISNILNDYNVRPQEVAECRDKILFAVSSIGGEAADAMREALKQIANGEGYYGAQAREYKAIARAALAKVEE